MDIFIYLYIHIYICILNEGLTTKGGGGGCGKKHK